MPQSEIGYKRSYLWGNEGVIAEVIATLVFTTAKASWECFDEALFVVGLYWFIFSGGSIKKLKAGYVILIYEVTNMLPPLPR